jgi:hypothetical protein
MAEKKKFISGAIKRPGALTKRVGGSPSEHPKKVAKLEKKSGLAGQQARFYENVLKPATAKRKKK